MLAQAEAQAEAQADDQTEAEVEAVALDLLCHLGLDSGQTSLFGTSVQIYSVVLQSFEIKLEALFLPQ